MSGRLFYLLIISLFTAGSIAGCKRTPTYPDTPAIEFSRLERYLVSNSFFASNVLIDSIIVTVNFKDGNGDLGMALNGPPYNTFDIQYDSGKVIKYNGTPSYSCENYDIGIYDSDSLLDTVLIIRNPHYYNYFIELLVKQSNGTYLPYTSYPNCGTLNGRFIPLAPPNYKGPIEGTLSFTLSNTNVLKYQLPNETIRFRVYIEDQGLNKSNTVETSDIVLTY
jgi:hypothetical protein